MLTFLYFSGQKLLHLVDRDVSSLCGPCVPLCNTSLCNIPRVKRHAFVSYVCVPSFLLFYVHTVAFLVFYVFHPHLLRPVSLSEFFFSVSITSCHRTQFIDVASVSSPHVLHAGEWAAFRC